MIPPRIPNRINVENGVRIRVAACRQRLRNSRINHRESNHSQIEGRSLAGCTVGSTDTPSGGTESRLSGTLDLTPLTAAPGKFISQHRDEIEEVGIT